MLDLFEQSTAAAAAPSPAEGRDLPATLGERFESDWTSNEAAVNGIRQLNLRNQAIREFSDQVSAAGGDVSGEYAKRRSENFTGLGGGLPAEPDGLEVANAALANLKASGKNPRLWLDPMTEDDVAKRSLDIRGEAVAAGSAMAGREQTWASSFGGFLGRGASSLNDPFNIPLAVVAPEESLGVLGHAALFGIGGVASQGLNEIVNAPFNEKAEPGYGARGDAAGNILAAGVGGAVLGGTLKAASNVLERIATGSWPTSLRDAANVVKSEAQIQTTNVLPGVAGEAEHRAAVAGAVEQTLRAQPVEPSAAASDLFEQYQNRVDSALTAYHGSPHSFDAFRTDGTIGTGEGTQAFGHGLYFAENPKVAEQYMAGGNIYQSRLHADPEAMLDHDKPFEQQTPQVQDALRSLGVTSGRGDQLFEMVANELHRQADSPLTGGFSEKAAQALRDAGVPGIRYLDAGSRGAGDGTRNFVVFDHNDVEITHKNGEPVGGGWLEQKIVDLARQSGHEIAPADAVRIADAVSTAKTDDEARAILGQIADRPQTLAATLPSQADIAADNRLAAAAAPRPGEIPAATMAEALADPKTIDAMRSDVEKAIDEGAKAGKAVQIPIGVDADGNPIYGSLARAMNEVDAYNALADQIAACALPGAMAEG